ncbi:MAG: hypothetical protein WC822_01580 [Candidatus Paceibacterota bacterium]|jgi:hypothetical protein
MADINEFRNRLAQQTAGNGVGMSPEAAGEMLRGLKDTINTAGIALGMWSPTPIKPVTPRVRPIVNKAPAPVKVERVENKPAILGSPEPKPKENGEKFFSGKDAMQRLAQLDAHINSKFPTPEARRRARGMVMPRIARATDLDPSALGSWVDVGFDPSGIMGKPGGSGTTASERAETNQGKAIMSILKTVLPSMMKRPDVMGKKWYLHASMEQPNYNRLATLMKELETSLRSQGIGYSSTGGGSAEEDNILNSIPFAQ